MNFSVMTMNLRVNNPDDGKNAWPYRIHKAAEVFKTNSPSIAGTQEGLFSMLSDLHECLPDYGRIGESRGGDTEDEYCAIFYKTDEMEMTDHGQFWLSETPEEANSISWESACPRICTWGAFRFKKDPRHQTVVYNTHLDHVSQQAREKGIQLILENMNRHMSQDLPVILMGDMNADPRNQAIQFLKTTSLRDAYSLSDCSPGATFHNFQGGQEGQPIDYIFASPNIEFLELTVDRSVIDGGYPSDHYPVIARLDI